ncbi:hypothetical protein WJX81_006076 [Elliptochloris bilobata]|uniref:Dolichol-phosphate mannosyltransferase subunit 3 n=1 Tax=Elliptochloris bilobata TaxID=381761 RepID=A0AAW1QZ64_9CHLO
MLRVVRILSCAAVAAAVWLSTLQLDHPPARRIAVLLLPLICAAAFGAYLLSALAYGLATFRTCPEELQALQTAAAHKSAVLQVHSKLLMARGDIRADEQATALQAVGAPPCGTPRRHSTQLPGAGAWRRP